MTNLVESEYVTRILFQEWHPQVFQDHHEMGSYGARLYVAPYCEPIHPYADPLIWREINGYGAHMAYKLEESGVTGVLNAAVFPAWSHLGFHWIGSYHNIANLLTESARSNLATPLYIHKSQLQGQGDIQRAFPHYQSQTNFPHPWRGGWWRLRDIVVQQKIAAWGLLDLAARHKDTVLWNGYQKAKRQTERGAENQPLAYLIRPAQRDPMTVVKLINHLFSQGIDIQKAKEDFTVNGLTYAAGTYVIALNQPKMGVIKTLLERTFFPDNVWTRRANSYPIHPYDTMTDTIAELMGVDVDPVNARLEGAFEAITRPEKLTGQLVGESKIGYLFGGQFNDSFNTVNRLLDQGVGVRHVEGDVTVGGRQFPPGAFLVSAESKGTLETVVRDCGITCYGLEEKVEAKQRLVQQLRIGMYQRYRGGSMDESWTWLVLEQLGFPYETLKDDDIKSGNLNQCLDVVILSDDPLSMIGGEEENSTNFDVPPEYRSGIGELGMKAIQQFVEDSGTLVTLNQACEFAIQELDVQVKNTLGGKSPKEFFCPGSTLKAHIDASHPLAYGMPDEGLIFFWDGPAFEVLPPRFNERYALVVQYPEKDLLQSGWLVGEEFLAGKTAMVAAQYHRGRVILLGFRPQHRAQTHATFKLLYNVLLG